MFVYIYSTTLRLPDINSKVTCAVYPHFLPSQNDLAVNNYCIIVSQNKKLHVYFTVFN